jgi:SAM-dependent methyltransferase
MARRLGMIAVLPAKVARHGFRRSFSLARARLAAVPAHIRNRPAERAFDELHAVDTAGILALERIDVRGPNRSAGVRYQPSHPDRFHALVGRVPADYETLTFVDYGSGKGRAVLLASEYPFHRIVGIEFSPELHRIAEANIRSWRGSDRRCDRIELVCCDAVDFEPPEEPLLAYFYNPFQEPVLGAVIERLRRSLERAPRPMFAALTGAEPITRAFEAVGFRRIHQLATAAAVLLAGPGTTF